MVFSLDARSGELRSYWSDSHLLRALDAEGASHWLLFDVDGVPLEVRRHAEFAPLLVRPEPRTAPALVELLEHVTLNSCFPPFSASRYLFSHLSGNLAEAAVRQTSA